MLITFIMAAPAVSGEEEITVYLNQEKMTFAQPPVLRDDSTLVPFRALFERLNMTVQWFGAEQRVTAEKEGTAVTLFIGSDEMLVNGQAIKLPTPPIICNNHTLVPLRAVSEAAGADVRWNGDTRSVYITAPESDFDLWGRQALELINDERLRMGLEPLKWDDALAELAEKHCEDMIERGYAAHVNPEGETPFDRMKNAGISYVYAAENIAAGAISPARAVEAWLESDEHRRNILAPNFEHVGISVIRGGEYGIYWVQEFATFK